jgi:hypothetical protein
MPTNVAPSQVGERGRALYTAQIKDKIAAEDRAKFIVIDIESGDYEIDADEDAATDRIEARHPQGVFYLMRADGGPSCFIGTSR